MRRTMLFLPSNNPNMICNGGLLGADSLIFDLEDAVAPDQKDAARELLGIDLAIPVPAGRLLPEVGDEVLVAIEEPHMYNANDAVARVDSYIVSVSGGGPPG